ncbi:nuclease-related domain-containing protein [Acholeplasma granularum]|uniref:nuclease-related domain-containing protein n=1 Tax=Acholeplasma granularum TaxID=264635 RepID=UPI00047022B7|nr:nuclease-related domain-containing protein [Acholeplasma granularum]
MAKKKKDTGSALVELIFIFIVFIIRTIIKTLLIIFDFITIYTSGFKTKSGKGFFKTYFDKGNYGEFKLYKKATKIFGKKYVYTNLYLDNENTEFTEVDVVAIASEGLYVFEMKNYGGYIYGSERDENWTQVFHRNSKHKFYNPLRQNYAHIKAVEKYLEVENQTIIPVIVFGNYAKLNKIDVSQKHNVLKINNLNTFIRKFRKQNPKLVNNEQKQLFAEKLILKSNMSEEVKQKHIEEVKALKLSKEN